MASTTGKALEIDAALHRALGAALYNRTWELLEMQDRSAAQDDEMIHTAHASSYHWTVGAPSEPIRLARAEWLCSRVYSTLGRVEPAIWHARRCYELAAVLPLGLPEQGCREDWDLAGAFEALARAHAVAGDAAESHKWAALGRQELEKIGDAEDRQFIEQDLESLSTAAG